MFSATCSPAILPRLSCTNNFSSTCGLLRQLNENRICTCMRNEQRINGWQQAAIPLARTAATMCTHVCSMVSLCIGEVLCSIVCTTTPKFTVDCIPWVQLSTTHDTGEECNSKSARADALLSRNKAVLCARATQLLSQVRQQQAVTHFRKLMYGNLIRLA